ncbi:MAG: L-histidine N(alpha)-methyltransferase [Acidimicrobiales bacterium]
MSPTIQNIDVHVHLEASDLSVALRNEAFAGLTAKSKELSPKWLYDERGCQLFDEITRLAEYYPTRTERSILDRHAGDIASLSNAETLLELGSGTSDKTRLLLDALDDRGTLRDFVALDVAQTTIVEAAEKLTIDYPDVSMTAVVGDFEHHIARLPRFGRQLIAFLGGTIGNLNPDTRAKLLSELARTMEPGDALLVGTDLVKDRARLVAAYDDAAGVTAAFNRNVLAVLNRELRGNFDLGRFAHMALFDEENSWIEMRLRSITDQRVHLQALGLHVDFVAGEDIRTEISTKFRPGQIARELTAAGLDPIRTFTDDNGDYALTLAVR